MDENTKMSLQTLCFNCQNMKWLSQVRIFLKKIMTINRNYSDI
jgi:hypothetical protein